jgi:hypothetical protein
VNIIHDINVCLIALVYMGYLVFCSKVGAQWPVVGQIVPIGMKASLSAQAPLSKKIRQGGKASQKTSNRRAPCLASVRGHEQGSAKVKTDRVLLDVDVGGFDELSLAIRQSFKDGHYSPSTGMEEREWQIMLEQFIASGVVVKNEVLNIDSD